MQKQRRIEFVAEVKLLFRSESLTIHQLNTLCIIVLVASAFLNCLRSCINVCLQFFRNGSLKLDVIEPCHVFKYRHEHFIKLVPFQHECVEEVKFLFRSEFFTIHQHQVNKLCRILLCLVQLAV